MTLHEAIEKLLKERGKEMSVYQIADELNNNKWFTKKDGSEICTFQVHGRTHNYSNLFKRDGTRVSLVDSPMKNEIPDDTDDTNNTNTTNTTINTKTGRNK